MAMVIWQNKFDDVYERCAIVANQIFQCADRFEELEEKYGLFIRYLRGGREVVATEKQGKKIDVLGSIQILVGMPILGLMLGGWIATRVDESFASLAVIGGLLFGFVVGICLLVFLPKRKPKDIEKR